MRPRGCCAMRRARRCNTPPARATGRCANGWRSTSPRTRECACRRRRCSSPTDAPPALYPKLLQATQAADLHTAIFNQRIVHEVLKSGMLEGHVDAIRARYRTHRDAMAAALDRHMTGLATWTRPVGGMFFWLELTQGVDAMEVLPKAVQAGVAFVPGAPFYAQEPRPDTLRLSFVTVPPEKIEAGVATLAGVLRSA